MKPPIYAHCQHHALHTYVQCYCGVSVQVFQAEFGVSE